MSDLDNRARQKQQVKARVAATVRDGKAILAILKAMFDQFAGLQAKLDAVSTADEARETCSATLKAISKAQFQAMSCRSDLLQRRKELEQISSDGTAQLDDALAVVDDIEDKMATMVAMCGGCEANIGKKIEARANACKAAITQLQQAALPEGGGAVFAAGCGIEHALEKAGVSVEPALVLDVTAELGTRSLAELCSTHLKCVQAVSLGDLPELKGKPLRNLEVGEVVEAIAAPVRDEKSGLQRTKVRAHKDDLEGWVTAVGNQGTTFLERVPFGSLPAPMEVDAPVEG